MLHHTTPDPPRTYRDLLTKTPDPFALYIVEDETTQTPQVSWIFKSHRAEIDALGSTPLIEFRLGTFQVRRVVVVVILMRSDHTPTIFETWINGYNLSRDGLRVLQLLQSQSQLALHFFNEDIEEQRTFCTENPSQPFFQRCYEQILRRPAWTMQEFDAAKDVLCAAYPSTFALWNAIQT